MVQWLRLHASTAGAQVRSLVGELRSCMPHGVVKKKKKKKKRRGTAAHVGTIGCKKETDSKLGGLGSRCSNKLMRQ